MKDERGWSDPHGNFCKISTELTLGSMSRTVGNKTSLVQALKSSPSVLRCCSYPIISGRITRKTFFLAGAVKFKYLPRSPELHIVLSSLEY